MGTCNFNYSNILVAIDTEGLESYHIDDIKENVSSDLEHNIAGFIACAGDQWINDGVLLGTVDINYSAGVYREIRVIMRNGYYGGINLDYTVTELIDGDYIVYSTYERRTKQKCNAIESILKKYGQELAVVGRFSDGTCVYEEVKKSS